MIKVVKYNYVRVNLQIESRSESTNSHDFNLEIRKNLISATLQMFTI